MAPPTGIEVDRHPDVEPAPPEHWYDRSSIKTDAVVAIEGQTEEDYFQHAPETQYCEFLDGTVYMPSPVGLRHQELVGFWYILLNGFRYEHGGGRVVTGPAVLRIAPGKDLEPDVFVTPVGAEPLPPRGLAMGEALLVVEVLSPGNRYHDLKRKAAVYREARIPEIVYVDDHHHVLTVERLVGETYQTRRIESGPWHSSVLDGFWLDVSWFWQDPLPDPRRCLEAILAGPPS